MMRLRKVDPDALANEYIYADPPISLTDLATRHNLARSGVAEYAKAGKWYERREEFRSKVGSSTMAVLASEWADYGAVVRRQMMKTATDSLTAYAKSLADGEVKVAPADAVKWVTVIRDLLADVEAMSRAERTDEPPQVVMDEDLARATIELVRNRIGDGAAD